MVYTTTSHPPSSPNLGGTANLSVIQKSDCQAHCHIVGFGFPTTKLSPSNILYRLRGVGRCLLAFSNKSRSCEPATNLALRKLLHQHSRGLILMSRNGVEEMYWTPWVVPRRKPHPTQLLLNPDTSLLAKGALAPHG